MLTLAVVTSIAAEFRRQYLLLLNGLQDLCCPPIWTQQVMSSLSLLASSAKQTPLYSSPGFQSLLFPSFTWHHIIITSSELPVCAKSTIWTDTSTCHLSGLYSACVMLSQVVFYFQRVSVSRTPSRRLVAKCVCMWQVYPKQTDIMSTV